jgi:transposase InsO family protein
MMNQTISLREEEEIYHLINHIKNANAFHSVSANARSVYQQAKQLNNKVTPAMVEQWFTVYNKICNHSIKPPHYLAKNVRVHEEAATRKLTPTGCTTDYARHQDGGGARKIRVGRYGSLLQRLYHTPSSPAAYGGPEILYYYARKIDKNIKRGDVINWLMSQPSYSMHRKIVYKFPRRKFLAKKINHIWQIDLMELPQISKENKGYRYTLLAIDVFSRKLYGALLKKKNGIEVTKGMQTIIKLNKVKPEKIMGDRGREFLNKHFQSFLKTKGIIMYHTESEVKASIIERLIRTIKEKIFRYFTANDTLQYYDKLQHFIKGYNMRKHTSIGMAPNEVNKSNSDKVWREQYGNFIETKKPNYKFQIGDHVRISKYKDTFKKGYINTFTREIFIVNNRFPTVPLTYSLIEEKSGEPIIGIFYEPELVLVKV